MRTSPSVDRFDGGLDQISRVALCISQRKFKTFGELGIVSVDVFRQRGQRFSDMNTYSRPWLWKIGLIPGLSEDPCAITIRNQRIDSPTREFGQFKNTRLGTMSRPLGSIDGDTGAPPFARKA